MNSKQESVLRWQDERQSNYIFFNVLINPVYLSIFRKLCLVA